MLLALGTRASPLAMAQTARVIAALGAQGVEARAQTLSTKGDRVQDRALQALGDKGIFTAELEAALRAGRVQGAVHSAKDMSVIDDPNLPIVAALPRDPWGDVLVSDVATDLAGLPAGARVGTSSLRRAAQVRDARPDLAIVPIRGNIQTRLKKWRDGAVDALILAAAGLERMGLRAQLPAHDLPGAYAPGQGIIAVQAPADAPHWRAINDRAAFAALQIERALVRGLGASCRQPMACWVAGAAVTLHAWDQGGIRHEATGQIETVEQAQALGAALRARLPGGQVG